MVSEVYNHGKSICCSQFSSFAQEPEMNFVLYPVPLLRISVQKIRPGLDTSPGGSRTTVFTVVLLLHAVVIGSL